MTTDYFESCSTLHLRKLRFKELAKIHHPDKGGDSKVMAEILRQYKQTRKSIVQPRPANPNWNKRPPIVKPVWPFWNDFTEDTSTTSPSNQDFLQQAMQRGFARMQGLGDIEKQDFDGSAAIREAKEQSEKWRENMIIEQLQRENERLNRELLNITAEYVKLKFEFTNFLSERFDQDVNPPVFKQVVEEQVVAQNKLIKYFREQNELINNMTFFDRILFVLFGVKLDEKLDLENE